MQKANVDKPFLEKIKGYINNPMYGLLLPLIGIDKQAALKKIDELEKMMGNQSFNQSSDQSFASKGDTDDLARFKKGLTSFKH